VFLEDMGLTEPGSAVLIRAAYKLLNLQTYFTAGVKEVRAWTIKVGDSAPKAAGVIHTDFEKGFIRAEVIAYEDFASYGSEAKVKKAAKTGNKEAQVEAALLERIRTTLLEGKSARVIVAQNQDEEDLLEDFQLITAKPVLYVCNVDEDSAVNGYKKLIHESRYCRLTKRWKINVV